MEHLYNPDLMSEQEIKQTFVARQGLVNELVALIEHQPTGAGVQHGVIIAPRGMGKTTVLMMVQFALQDRGLTAQWQPVRFPEESYGIYDLADFWLETLNHLSEAVGDPNLRQRAEGLKAEYPATDDLQEAALATLKDWCRHANKRLVLLVDNFDMILEQIGREADNARLRHLLMNDGTFMLLGGATAFFKEAHAYDQPLYNFFRIYDLPKLEFADMENLLRQRANIDGTPNFERTLKANKSRLRVLQYFTGGNPRLVLMLYRVIMRSEIVEVRHGLEKLLDKVTPYYKHKIESLPPQQRKILDHIARVSSETHEGQTPGQIAAATRLTPQGVSSQLKRLSELGYVRAANLRGRNSYYTLSEPLYAIWYQMRFGRAARRRMQWLVNFLKGYYDAEELGSESRRLEDRYHELLNSGFIREAKEVLEHRRYLVEAMDNEEAQVKELESVILGYIGIKDTQTLKDELITPDVLDRLSAHTLNALVKDNCISQEDVHRVTMNRQISKVTEIIHDLKQKGATEEAGWFYLFKFVLEELVDELDSAEHSWLEAAELGRDSPRWQQSATNFLLNIAATGRLQFVQKLIAESITEEIFLPLTRALDYLLTGDKTTIKKLSPEVRLITDEIIEKLRPVAEQSNISASQKISPKVQHSKKPSD